MEGVFIFHLNTFQVFLFLFFLMFACIARPAFCYSLHCLCFLLSFHDSGCPFHRRLAFAPQLFVLVFWISILFFLQRIGEFQGGGGRPNQKLSSFFPQG
jgi:hypothetical protein